MYCILTLRMSYNFPYSQYIYYFICFHKNFNKKCLFSTKQTILMNFNNFRSNSRLDSFSASSMSHGTFLKFRILLPSQALFLLWMHPNSRLQYLRHGDACLIWNLIRLPFSKSLPHLRHCIPLRFPN